MFNTNFRHISVITAEPVVCLSEIYMYSQNDELNYKLSLVSQLMTAMPNSGDDQVIGRFLVLITLLLWSFPPGMILALYFVPMDPITHLYRIYFKSALRSGAAYVSYNMIRFMAIPVVYEACRIYTICVIVPVLFITRLVLV